MQIRSGAAIALAFAFMTTVTGFLHAEGPGYALLAPNGAPVRWVPERSGSDIELTFSIIDRATEIAGAVNCASMTGPGEMLARSQLSDEDLRGALREAFAAWRSVNTPKFREATAEETADIVIGAQGDPSGIAFANLIFAKDDSVRISGVERIASAQICLNPLRVWKRGEGGSAERVDLVYTLTHEIGHVLGLDHPGARGHLMSFRYPSEQQKPTAGDIAGIVALYGAELPHPAQYVAGHIRSFGQMSNAAH